MSPGVLQFGGRHGNFTSLQYSRILVSPHAYINFLTLSETVEKIHLPSALSYFSRLRLVYNLIPLLKLSTASPRVITILGGGLEKAIDTDDIETRKDFTAMKAASAATTCSLSLPSFSPSPPP